jgi:hypothetical protein
MSPHPASTGRATFDIGLIVRKHRAQLESEHPLSPQQKRVLTDIAQCRTAALGGHLDACRSCDYELPSYNSCRNRHCPKCQALAQQRWIEKRRAQLLDVGHFHVVFTVPAQLRPLARSAPRVVFDALFHAAAETLTELAHSHLGVTLGVTLVLHTWTRDLRFHPHVHAIVTAGGLTLDGRAFKRTRGGFLFNDVVMGKLLRGKVMAELHDAHAAGQLADVDSLRDPVAFGRLMASLAKTKPWNVKAKAPFKKSQHVLDYLGRYTHRVGIANSRLLEVSETRVVFRTKGEGCATLTPVAFLGRFVQHVLPDGLHKIRHIGLYAPSCEQKRNAARALLQMAPPTPRTAPSWEEQLLEVTGRDVLRCPRCLAPLVRSPLPSIRVPLPPVRAPTAAAA